MFSTTLVGRSLAVILSWINPSYSVLQPGLIQDKINSQGTG